MKMSQNNQGSFSVWPFSCLPFSLPSAETTWSQGPFLQFALLQPPTNPWLPALTTESLSGHSEVRSLYQGFESRWMGRLLFSPLHYLTHSRKERTGRTGAHEKAQALRLDPPRELIGMQILTSPHSRFPFSAVRCGPRNLCLNKLPKCPHAEASGLGMCVKRATAFSRSSQYLYWFPRTDVTNYHKLRGLKQQKFILPEGRCGVDPPCPL